MRKLHITTLILLIPITSDWAIANSSRTFPTGVFMQKSPLCTDPTNEDGVCKSDFKDCLSITKSGTHYRVNLHSVQAQQSICSFSYDMSPLGPSTLQYASRKGGSFKINHSGKKITIDARNFNASYSGAGICGAYADIDELSFPDESKVISTDECPSPER